MLLVFIGERPNGKKALRFRVLIPSPIYSYDIAHFDHGQLRD